MTTTSPPTSDAASPKIGRRLDARPTPRRTDAYPWSQWENGEWWLIKRGEQFRCTPAGLRSTLRSRASKLGTTVDVVLRPDDPQVPVGKEHLYVAFRFDDIA